MPYLFLFHVGPVQSFIASARRTRDLWFGSHLLSELSKAGAKTIADICRPDSLIFPAPLDYKNLEPDSGMNVANKLLARLPDQLTGKHRDEQGDKSVPRYVGDQVTAAIEARLHEIYSTMIGRVGGNNIDAATARKQVEDFVEHYWVATYYQGQDKDEYATKRHELENMLAARKNTRDYRPVTWGSSFSKSSIDGQYESVIPDRFYSRYKDEDTPANKLAKEQQLYHIFHAGPAEHLSGIDLLKRRGSFATNNSDNSDETFLSTSHLAALPYLARLENDPKLNTEPTLFTLQQQWKVYESSIQAIFDNKENAITEKIPRDRRALDDLHHLILEDYDGALLFEQRLLEDAQNRQDETGKKIYKEAQSNLKQFFTTINNALGTTIAPTPYYAIIHADGDSMGEAINYHAKQGYMRHREFSQKLESFAQSVSGIVMKHKGAPVYSGGDDVLALLPLHTVLACAQELEKTFSIELNKQFKDESTEEAEARKKIIKPTLSVGIAIVHHLSLLNEALDLARAAEKAAKNVSGKNGLAISLSKRSGETYTIAFSWQELKQPDTTQAISDNTDKPQTVTPLASANDNQPQATGKEAARPYLFALIDAYSTERLPRGSAYELRDMAQRFSLFTTLATEKEKGLAKLSDIYKLETRRILRRKLNLNLPVQPDDEQKGFTDAKGTEPKEKEARVQLLNQLLAHEDALFEQASNITKLQKALSEFIQEMIIAETLADAQDIAEYNKKSGNENE